MGSLDLMLMCLSAFIAVFVLLSVLALIMRVIIAVFPEKVQLVSDTAVLAALATVVSSVYPGTRVTKVEEIQ
jgi:uncharacterized membrane protein YqjE